MLLIMMHAECCMLDADADADADAANATAMAPAQEPILLSITNYLLYKWSIALPNNTCHNPTPHTLE